MAVMVLPDFEKAAVEIKHKTKLKNIIFIPSLLCPIMK
jgi:hypothetical protein